MQTGWVQTDKPGRGALIDPTNPLARGLVALYGLNEGAGLPVDFVSKNQATAFFTGHPTWVGSTAGMALKFVGASSQGIILGTAPQLNVNGGPFTVAFLGSPAAGTFAFIIQANGTNVGWTLAVDQGGNNEIGLFINSTFFLSSTGVVDGNLNTYSVSQSAQTAAGGIQFYKNGAAAGVATPTAWIAPYTSSRLCALGYNASNNTRFLTGSIVWLGVWSRALAASEHAALAANPWQIFAPVIPWAVLQAPPVSFMPWIFGDQIQEAMG